MKFYCGLSRYSNGKMGFVYRKAHASFHETLSEQNNDDEPIAK